MNMQIKSIILYNKNGKIRQLPLKLGAVNIITGESNTGKSAIIPIIDYCLGRTNFEVPDGVIRETVAWYAVLYQVYNTQVFIAKHPPFGAKTKQNRVYYETGTEISVPPFSKLVLNSSDEKVIENLSQLVTTSLNVKVLTERKDSIESLKTTIEYASFYLFQRNNVIANNEILFHRQGDIHKIIKETLPYFLGIVQEDDLRLKKELDEASRDLKHAQNKLRNEEHIVGDRIRMGQSLLVEAQQVGLVDRNFKSENIDEINEQLEKTRQWQATTSPLINDIRLPQLRQELYELRRKFQQKHEEINLADSFVREAEGYSTEANDQLMKLESIKLFDSQDDLLLSVCPLCSSNLPQATPRISAMQEVIINLQDNLQAVESEQPMLHQYIQTLKDELEKIRLQIANKQAAIKAVLDEQDEKQDIVQKIIETNTFISHVVGRISWYLESTQSVDKISSLREKVEEVEKRVKLIKEQLDKTDFDNVKVSILEHIGSQMTQWATELGLEHNGIYRFDLNQLTVIVGKKDGRSIQMKHMGGGGLNLLGCHLITLLALHKHFLEQKRPVPNFLILDQPIRGYFPSKEAYDAAIEKTTDEVKDTDADMVIVKRIFKFLFDVCKELSPNFQIIVTEHANLEDSQFQNALVDKPWQDGKALIPESWLSK
jgi:hypothetical protein